MRAAVRSSGMLAVNTSSPDTRISLGVYTRHDLDTGRRRNEVCDVGEPSDACPANGLIDLLKASGTSPDLFEAKIDGPEKIGTQA